MAWPLFVLGVFGLSLTIHSVAAAPRAWSGSSRELFRLVAHDGAGSLSRGVAGALGRWSNRKGVDRVVARSDRRPRRHGRMRGARHASPARRPRRGGDPRALGEGIGDRYEERVAPSVAPGSDRPSAGENPASVLPWARQRRDGARHPVRPRRRRDPAARRAPPSRAPRRGPYARLRPWRRVGILGFRERQGLPLMRHLAARGWVCFSIGYRLSPRATFPEHLLDVKRGLAWVREHAAEHGADPDFVVLCGNSAGAHLAALAALTANDARYQPGFEEVNTSVAGCIGLYGIYDFTGSPRPLAARKLQAAPRSMGNEDPARDVGGRVFRGLARGSRTRRCAPLLPRTWGPRHAGPDGRVALLCRCAPGPLVGARCLRGDSGCASARSKSSRPRAPRTWSRVRRAFSPICTAPTSRRAAPVRRCSRIGRSRAS